MEDTRFALADPVISIGTLAKKVGLSVSTIRKYEIEGLIIPHRTATGRRLFSHEDIDRVRTIHSLIREKGLNIEGIRRLLAMLPCWELTPRGGAALEQCSAARDALRPCWMTMSRHDPSQAEKCRNCAVYRYGSRCTEDVKGVVFGSDGRGLKEAVLELLKRRKAS